MQQFNHEPCKFILDYSHPKDNDGRYTDSLLFSVLIDWSVRLCSGCRLGSSQPIGFWYKRNVTSPTWCRVVCNWPRSRLMLLDRLNRELINFVFNPSSSRFSPQNYWYSAWFLYLMAWVISSMCYIYTCIYICMYIYIYIYIYIYTRIWLPRHLGCGSYRLARQK